MNDPVQILEFVKREVKSPLIVTDFPTVGLVGAIACNFLADSLGLELIGGLVSPGLPPAALVKDGKVFPAFRILAGNEVCGPDRQCDQLIVITSELMPPPDTIWPLAEAILQWSKANGAKLIVTLEGVVQETENPAPRVWGVATTEAGQKALKQHAIEPLKQGAIAGLSAAILSLAQDKSIDVVCLLAEAHQEIPDARAASALISAVGRLTPRLKIDPAPLLKEAERIEQQMKLSLTKFEDQKKRQPEPASSMFA